MLNEALQEGLSTSTATIDQALDDQANCPTLTYVGTTFGAVARVPVCTAATVGTVSQNMHDVSYIRA